MLESSTTAEHSALASCQGCGSHHRLLLQVWDLGGQTSIRPYWRCYYPNTQAIIYVVDSSDTERISTSRWGTNWCTDENGVRRGVLLSSDAGCSHSTGLHVAALACNRQHHTCPAGRGTMSRRSLPGINAVRPAAGKSSTRYWQRYADCSAFVVAPCFSFCDKCPSHCVPPAAGGAFKCTYFSVCQQAGVLRWSLGILHR